jgi:FkbM family methyltransferase
MISVMKSAAKKLFNIFGLEIRLKPQENAQSKQLWIDVGAHLGETTMDLAVNHPEITVLAFEPNWNLSRRIMGRITNFLVFPMAVSEKDGLADFFLNAADFTSSLLPFDPNGLDKWKGPEDLRIESQIVVPTIRLDTFMRLMNIEKVDYLKIDTQGADFQVILSAGARLKDIRKIQLEVDLLPVRLYHGSVGKNEIVGYLKDQGFVLSHVEVQSQGQEENLTFVRKMSAI